MKDRGHHLALVVHDVDCKGSCTFIELLKIDVDLAGQFVIASVAQEIEHFLFQSQSGRKISIFSDFTFQTGGIKVETVASGGLQFGKPHALAHLIGRKRSSGNQYRYDQKQNKKAQGEADLHAISITR